MDEQDKMQEEKDFFQNLQDQNGFKITPCESNFAFADKKLERLNLTSEQKTQLNQFLRYIPDAVAAGAMAGAYTVRFPKGLPHTLISLKQGGLGSQILDNGKIVGTASFYPMLGQAAVLGVFTAMSIATGQFFLKQINNELNKINIKLDEIMKFLYGEKRAELLSEVKFIKYAYENYAYIMAHDTQRAATIGNIQEAKKVAMKDIEFYRSDLANKIESAPGKYFSELVQAMDNEIKHADENLDFSLQLYLMSSMMEIYYAQNYEKNYINNIESEIKNYVKICNDDMLYIYGRLSNKLKGSYASGKEQSEKQKRSDQFDELRPSLDKKYNDICEKLYTILHKSTQETQGTEYYIKQDGDGYNVYYNNP